MIQIRCRL